MGFAFEEEIFFLLAIFLQVDRLSQGWLNYSWNSKSWGLPNLGLLRGEKFFWKLAVASFRDEERVENFFCKTIFQDQKNKEKKRKKKRFTFKIWKRKKSEFLWQNKITFKIYVYIDVYLVNGKKKFFLQI